jgi:deoxyribodipyrimidine photo-lyase
LHFGQISPLYLALQIDRVGGRQPAAKESFLEELIVRRELAMNFANYAPHYDSYKCIPNWARETHAAHQKDLREYVYTRR